MGNQTTGQSVDTIDLEAVTNRHRQENLGAKHIDFEWYVISYVSQRLVWSIQCLCRHKVSNVTNEIVTSLHTFIWSTLYLAWVMKAGK